MIPVQDLERADREEYQSCGDETEREGLLSSAIKSEESTKPISCCAHSLRPTFGWLHVSLAFLAGVIACLAAQYTLWGSSCFSSSPSNAHALAPPYVGSTERHEFPPTSPTNAFPSLFPTDVGYPGGTPTGAEPALVVTAPSYPIQSGAAQLVAPPTFQTPHGGQNKTFDLFTKWGNLSPWYSVDRTAFGIDSGPEPPETCRVTGLHLLHRHGARYPTAMGKFPTFNFVNITQDCSGSPLWRSCCLCKPVT
jgi:hypothetical protein